MVTVKAGSHVHQILQLLAISGEFPASSLHLLGNERVVKALVHRLESVQDVRFSLEGQTYHTKMLQVSGYRDMRTVRLSKGAIPLLGELHPEAEVYYLRASHGHSFSGSVHHIGRNHRVGEAIALAMMAGLEYRPYALPKLHHGFIEKQEIPKPSFYIARDIKGTEFDNADKTMFTRIVGAVFSPGGCYAVYNTRSAVMKWSGMGEFKAQNYLSELARCNYDVSRLKQRSYSAFEIDSTLLLGNNPGVALQTILESDKSKRKAARMDSIYPRVHFIPLNSDGIRLLQILTLPDWNERILDALFESEVRPKPGYGFMEYDACINGVYVLSHLDSDLARLIRFREGLRLETDTERQFGVVCYPWQAEFLRTYLDGATRLRIIKMENLIEYINQDLEEQIP